MVVAAITVLGSYLLGSIPFGVLVGRLFKGIDLRRYGSGGTGALNAYRVLGIFPALLVAVLDIAKGYAAGLAGHLFAGGLYPALPVVGAVVACIAAVAGHIWPVWLRPITVRDENQVEQKRWGGKGLATTAGALAALSWPTLLQIGFGWGAYYLLGPLLQRFMGPKDLEPSEERRFATASVTAALTIPVFGHLAPPGGGLPHGNWTVTALLAVWGIILTIPQWRHLGPKQAPEKMTRQQRRAKDRFKPTAQPKLGKKDKW